MSRTGDSSENNLISQLHGFLRDSIPRRPALGTITRTGIKAANVKLTEDGTLLQNVEVIGGTRGLIQGSPLYLLYLADNKVVGLNPAGAPDVQQQIRDLTSQINAPGGSGSGQTVSYGEFVPAWVGNGTPGAFTYTEQVGRWSAIGGMTWFWGHIRVTSIDTPPTGDMYISTNLPPPLVTPGFFYDGGFTIQSLAYYNFNVGTTGQLTLAGNDIGGSLGLFPQEIRVNDTYILSSATNFTNTVQIGFSGFYRSVF